MDGRGGEGSGEKQEPWKMIEGIRDKGGETTRRLKAPVWPEEEGSQEGGGQSTEEYGGRTVPKAWRRWWQNDYIQDGTGYDWGWKGPEERCRDQVKDNNERLISESKEVLRIWAANFKELLNGKGAPSCLELPCSVRREVEVEGIRQEEVETAMHKMKKARRQGQLKCG